MSETEKVVDVSVSLIQKKVTRMEHELQDILIKT